MRFVAIAVGVLAAFAAAVWGLWNLVGRAVDVASERATTTAVVEVQLRLTTAEPGGAWGPVRLVVRPDARRATLEQGVRVEADATGTVQATVSALADRVHRASERRSLFERLARQTHLADRLVIGLQWGDRPAWRVVEVFRRLDSGDVEAVADADFGATVGEVQLLPLDVSAARWALTLALSNGERQAR